jgi:DNA-nicking Smr family endonuclease
MSRPRRPRSLSAEERRLWAQVARGITPMQGRVLPAEPEPALPAIEVKTDQKKVPPRPSAPSAVIAKPAPAVPPLAPLDRKTLQALRRGARPVDAVIDLHGMRQSEAHDALLRFLHRTQAAGHSLVLVITGKGGAGSGDALFEERGVLRRMVPHWLRLPDLRSIVIGFEEASPQHGGSGAIYVRVRRRRGSGL